MPNEPATNVIPAASPPSLIQKFAARFGVESNKMLTTLKATAFRGDVSNEQMMALLIVADQYGLNPWTREIYAFPDKNNGIVPVVGVDGWARIINEHPQFNGLEFSEPAAQDDKPPAWIECTIHRKDREHPTRLREHLTECRRDTAPWRSHPRRMLRHKAMIQTARIAFGFVGIHDEDEAQRIIEGGATLAPERTPAIASINAKLGKPPVAPIDGEATPVPDDRPPLALDGGAPQYLTFAEVMDAIAKAATDEALDLAADMIRSVADPAHRAELEAAAVKRRKELAK